MLPKILTQIFGSRNDRLLKTYRRTAQEINELEPRFEALDDAALRAKTDEFRQRLTQGEALDKLLPEAFAVVREAGKRVLKMRHFDVQLIGGIALHEGKIAEMRTGEGKTLAATLPVYLNALQGKGVHVVTVNDYLARRDAEWMGRHLHLPGPDGGRQRAGHAARGEAGRLCRRRDLRHEQRIRLRLPARQHGLRGGRPRGARAVLRHRRRGRLDPHRRSAHAADHQRPGRGPHRPVRAHQRRGAEVEEADRRGRPAHRRRRDRAGRLHGRRKEPPGLSHRGRPRERREDPRRSRAAGRRRQPVRPGQHLADAPCVCGVARQSAVPPRPALRGAERRGGHRRRVHRPADDRAALVAMACTRRSRPRKACRSRTRTRRWPR